MSFHKVADLSVTNFIKKNTTAQVFSRKFCDFFKNTHFLEYQ